MKRVDNLYHNVYLIHKTTKGDEMKEVFETHELNLTEQELELIYRLTITHKHHLEEMFREQTKKEKIDLALTKLIVNQIEKMEI